MFGVKDDERGNGIHQPPVERNRIFVAQMGNTKVGNKIGKKPRKQSPGFCRL